MDAVGRHQGPGKAEESVGDLGAQASQQISELVREEMQLARAEMTQKGKRFGVGGGLFGGSGLVGFLAAQALVAAVIAALALLLPLWASALITAALLAAVAAVMAAAGKKQIGKAGTLTPEQAINSVKADVVEIKEAAHR
ncbi:phage holin family protein [Streptomyces sp. A0592]|uniref:phage holin family protein n=1 Tax=Streptomyces sp. A0592 TaxID=2563099 RepID=UPI00109EABEA|nr:phage holin family protein [Streptomyces sp. A0592]THA75439.1 phage holin family protein [Streptomyces sp. A0592]